MGGRGFATLAVMGAHATVIAGTVQPTDVVRRAVLDMGEVAMPMFFALSAFLLYRPFVAAAVAGREATSFGRYAWNRVLRIFPVYWALLTILMLWPGLKGLPTSNALDLLGSYSLVGNCCEPRAFTGIVQSWSLWVELTFYVLLAVVVAFSPRGWALNVRSGLGLLAAAVALSITTIVVVHARGDHWLLASSSILGRGDAFAVGALLAVVSAREIRGGWARPVWWLATRPLLTVGLAAGLVVGATGAGGLHPDLGYPPVYGWAGSVARHLIFVVAGTLVVIPLALCRTGGRAPRVWTNRPIVALGRWSYSTYLLHLAVMFELERRHASEWIPGSGAVSLFVVSLPITVVLAACSYRLFERPFIVRRKAAHRGRAAAST